MTFYSKYIWDFLWHFMFKADACHMLKYCWCVIYQSNIYIFIKSFALNLLMCLVPWNCFSCFTNENEVIISIYLNCAKCNWRDLYFFIIFCMCCTNFCTFYIKELSRLYDSSKVTRVEIIGEIVVFVVFTHLALTMSRLCLKIILYNRFSYWPGCKYNF